MTEWEQEDGASSRFQPRRARQRGEGVSWRMLGGRQGGGFTCPAGRHSLEVNGALTESSTDLAFWDRLTAVLAPVGDGHLAESANLLDRHAVPLGVLEGKEDDLIPRRIRDP